jgi:hypothetical protein
MAEHDDVPQPVGRPQGGMKSETGKAAYWRMQYESAIGALADLIAENTENVEEIERLRGQIAEPDPYDNHDRRILEAADAGEIADARIVVVKCPHRIGLTLVDEPAPGMGEFFMRLPCPCNDRSQIVASVVPTDAAKGDVAGTETEEAV